MDSKMARRFLVVSIATDVVLCTALAIGVGISLAERSYGLATIFGLVMIGLFVLAVASSKLYCNLGSDH